MSKHVVVLEIPTEAGTHWHGQSKAPSALRDAGLQRQLENNGYKVTTVSALPDGPQLWQPSPLTASGVRDEQAVLETLEATRKTLDEQFKTYTDQAKAGSKLPIFPLAIGGPCAFTPAIASSIATHITSQSDTERRKFGILWVDSDADLTLPTETSAISSTAVLDSMTLSHLTQRHGSLSSMKKFTTHEGNPVINSDNIVLFGLDITQPKPPHFAYLLDNHFRVLTNQIVKHDPVAAMETALKYLDERCDAILLHFDVDAVDSAEWPLGNFPSYGGLGFDAVMSAVQLALGHEKVVAMIVTEVNPNNDPDGKMVKQLVDGLVKGMSQRLSK